MVPLQFSPYSSSVRHWRCCYGFKTLRSSGRSELFGQLRKRERKRRRLILVSANSGQERKCDGGSGGEEGSGFSNDDGAPLTPQPSLSSVSPYQILGVDPSCSFSQLKTAFRQKVKEFHPDVYKDMKDPDQMIKRVIQAYEFLSKHHYQETSEGDSLDPFEHPECVASDVFVNEVLCIGKGCPYSCVTTAPFAFSFTTGGSAARTCSQGHGDDYQVMLAAGQCPRRCIHYVTPSQRVILEELLFSILDSPYDPAEIAFLESLIIKGTLENNRYQKPKMTPKASTEFADWY